MVQLAISMFLVCLVSIPNEANTNNSPLNQISHAKIQENFQSYFNTKNNHQIIGINRELLMQEAMQERKAFDSMRKEIQAAQHRKNYIREDYFREKRDNPIKNTIAFQQNNEETLLDKCLLYLYKESFKSKKFEELHDFQKRLVIDCMNSEYMDLEREMIQLREEMIQRREDHIKFKIPIMIKENVDIFMKIHDYKVALSKEENRILEKISDPQRRSKEELIKICEHILSDLNTSDIEDLNRRINSPDNKVLSKEQESERRHIFCSTIIYFKIERIQINSIILEGKRLKRLEIFRNESWNESIGIFLNARTKDRGFALSEEEDDLIFEDKSASVN